MIIIILTWRIVHRARGRGKEKGKKKGGSRGLIASCDKRNNIGRVLFSGVTPTNVDKSKTFCLHIWISRSRKITPCTYVRTYVCVCVRTRLDRDDSVNYRFMQLMFLIRNGSRQCATAFHNDNNDRVKARPVLYAQLPRWPPWFRHNRAPRCNRISIFRRWYLWNCGRTAISSPISRSRLFRLLFFQLVEVHYFSYFNFREI